MYFALTVSQRWLHSHKIYSIVPLGRQYVLKAGNFD